KKNVARGLCSGKISWRNNGKDGTTGRYGKLAVSNPGWRGRCADVVSAEGVLAHQGGPANHAACVDSVRQSAGRRTSARYIITCRGSLLR
ncbi:hypothetical protein L209DRAFT_799104, partial [Thermothelomyces heterothallicus CBS 203.75]